MRSLQPFDRHIGELLETAETSAAVSLAPITQAVDGSYSLLFRTGRDGLVAEASCYGVDTDYVERLKEASHLRLLPAWLDRLEEGSVVDRAAYGSDQQFSRTDFCNHVVRPEGRFHCVIATPITSGTDRFHLVVGRPRSKSEFDADNCRLLRWMLPQVAEILRLRADLAATRLSLSRAEQALDGLQEPVFVVTRDATVVSANTAARRLAMVRDALWLDAQGRLTAASPADSGKLRKAVHRVTEEDAATSVLIVRSLAGRPPLRLSLSRLQEAEHAGTLCDRVLVVAEPSEMADDGERLQGTARIYGLTKREGEVVALLVRGLTLKGAARDLGMSYNTARSYVRQVFEKTAVHRQSDLLRLFAAGHHPAGRDRG